MEEPPLIGKNYHDDMLIKTWCNEYPDDTRCSCVLLPPDIQKVDDNNVNPYFCWFAPCKISTNFIPYFISESQKICNNINCSITLGDVQIIDGIIQIENNCINNFTTESMIISDTFYNTASTDLVNLFLPYYSWIILICLMILFILL